MTPSGSSKTSSRTKARRKLKPRRSCHYKKKHHHHHHNHPQINDMKKEEIDIPTESFPSPASSSIGSNDTIDDSRKMLEDTYNSDDEVNNNEVSSTSSTITTTITTTTCSTPKARRFRIPETPMACPPAPKKPKVLSNCSLHKSSRVFFAPPELETFFLAALRDISV